MKQLCFSNKSEIIVESPDRFNIKISCKCIPNIHCIYKIFAWLIADLKTPKDKMERYIIFCESISDVSKIYLAFVKVLSANCDYVNMYYSKINERVKGNLRANLAVEFSYAPTLRE